MLARAMTRTAFKPVRLAALTWVALCLVNVAMAAPADSTNPIPTNSIPFEFVSGRILVDARVNDARPATVMLDTGYSVNMLSPELTESLGLKRTGHIIIVGIAGEEPADQFEEIGRASCRERV